MTTWAEWNITPSGDHDAFMTDVIYPFTEVHEMDSWHFFWEWGEGDDQENEVLRFRILGTRLVHQDFRDHLSGNANTSHPRGVADWYEGAHGKRGETYDGEAVFYGKKVWEKTYKLWHAHSELALLLAVQAVNDELERPRSMHWKRTAHLTCNQLELPDVRMCLEQGHRYMTIFPQMTDREVSARDSKVLAELDRYLYPPDHI